MAKPQIVHYTQLKAAIREVLSAHKAVKAGVATHAEVHKNAIEAHRQKMDANARLRSPRG